MFGNMLMMGSLASRQVRRSRLDFPVKDGRDAAFDTRAVDVSVRVIRLEANGRSMGTWFLH